MVWTLMRSGFGVSAGGSLAQLDTLSTGLNRRSDNGRCRPIVVLVVLVFVIRKGNQVFDVPDWKPPTRE